MNSFLLYILAVLISSTCIADVSTKPGSEIGLKLLGAITTGEEGVALLKETHSGKVYPKRSGSPVLDGYTLIKVTVKYLLLYKNGTNYIIYGDKFSRDFARKDIIKKRAVITSGIEREGNNVKVGSRLRDKLINEDLAGVLMQAAAEHVMRGGKIIGWRMSQIDPGSIYELAGLQNGDIIKTLNGNELGSVALAIKTLKSLKNANNVDVLVERGGVEMQMSIQVSN